MIEIDINKTVFITSYIVSATYFFFKILKSISKKKSKKIKKIKNQNSHHVNNNKNLIVKILDAASIVTRKIDNREEIRLKLARAGNPFKKIGINENNFTIFKLLIVVLGMSLQIVNKKTTWWLIACYGLGSYAYVEWILYFNKKRRHKAIESELEVLILTTIEALNQGLVLSDIFHVLVNKINKVNPLYAEIVRVKVKMSAKNINTDIESILDEMQDRIGMDQIDNYCLALKQYEISGKAIKMLRKQLDLLRSKGNFKQRRETQYKANINSLTSIIIVSCMLILIGVPMIVNLMQSPIFKK